ncbi:hypothetical protein SDC9_140612 [bioreactor metagenome]|uniref:Uncharacterized protein n=1 Tax=bioreactor metagenome TaxID=1076179 RepID=A0A645DVZ6_9ZZZZ
MHQAGRGQGLHGHTRRRVLLQHGIEDGVGDPVTDLVRVAFGDRLGGEEVHVRVGHDPDPRWRCRHPLLRSNGQVASERPDPDGREPNGKAPAAGTKRQGADDRGPTAGPGRVRTGAAGARATSAGQAGLLRLAGEPGQELVPVDDRPLVGALADLFQVVAEHDPEADHPALDRGDLRGRRHRHPDRGRRGVVEPYVDADTALVGLQIVGQRTHRRTLGEADHVRGREHPRHLGESGELRRHGRHGERVVDPYGDGVGLSRHETWLHRGSSAVGGVGLLGCWRVDVVDVTC